MTDPNITPPSELVREWTELPLSQEEQLVVAARWGADQELEACCDQLQRWGVQGLENLRNTRRPKQQALKALEALEALGPKTGISGFALIRRALELVPEGPAVTPAAEPAAAPDRPLWVEMRDVYSDPSRIHWSGHGFARELRIVADWLERIGDGTPWMEASEVFATSLRAEAERAEAP